MATEYCGRPTASSSSRSEAEKKSGSQHGTPGAAALQFRYGWLDGSSRTISYCREECHSPSMKAVPLHLHVTRFMSTKELLVSYV
jgi:hypothetical protein